MFRTIITETPFTSEAANAFFINSINGELFYNDATFLSTLRALVYPRMENGDSVTLTFSSKRALKQDIDVYPERALQVICSDVYEGEGNIHIINFVSNNAADNAACMDLIESDFEKAYDGWYKIEKITDFFRRAFRVYCFIKPEIKSVTLFIDSMDIRKMHYLQCAIFAFMPWYFKPDSITDLEMELINSLREKTSDKYEDCLESIALLYDFKTTFIRKSLKGLETAYARKRLEAMRNEVNQIVNKIKGYNSEINSLLMSKFNKETDILGLETTLQNKSDEDSEIMEYFLCNDKLSLQSVRDDTITFVCHDYIEYYDEEMASRVINNPRSYIYYTNGNYMGDYISSEDMKKFMTAVFIDQEIKIRVCAAYRFSLRGNIESLDHYEYGYEFRNCTPNVHIDAYSCMGNYQCIVNDLLMQHDYIGAIEQCIASCKSLNFGDSTVMNELMSRIYGLSRSSANMRCVELPDGKVVTPKDAIEWLNNQESEDDDNE